LQPGVGSFGSTHDHDDDGPSPVQLDLSQDQFRSGNHPDNAMPIRIIINPYQAAIDPESKQRRQDLRRLLHIAFDFGYLFDPNEIEEAWKKANKDTWVPLPEKDAEIWFKLQKVIEAAIIEGSDWINADSTKPLLLPS
jgi:hypothetical protein